MTPINKILHLLKEKYPEPHIALKASDPLQLLVATILSAQCTDVRVNMVTEQLFKKYRKVDDYAKASSKNFEQEIRSTGFYHAKARNIIAAADKILKNFRGRVPNTMEDLLELPGVARKTANVVLYNAFGKNEGIAVDTHVMRLSQRLGITPHSDPVKIELDLMNQLDSSEWGDFTLRLITHGREVCLAKAPRCPACIFKKICASRKTFYPQL